MQDLEPDQSLAQRALGGDEAAWQAIYESTCDRLFSLLRYQVGDRDEALDLLQETYVQAWKRLGEWRGEAPLGAWLRRIALRKAIDWKRGALRRLKRQVPVEEATALIEPTGHDLRFDSEHREFTRALAGLSPQQRAVLLLREWEQWDFREIAEAIGCKESTARVHHVRAKERLRTALGHLAGSFGSESLKGQTI